jgi:hypothetical protein
LGSKDSKPRRVIKLDECQFREINDKYYGKYAFGLSHPVFESEYILGTDDKAAFTDWVNRVKKSMVTACPRVIF